MSVWLDPQRFDQALQSNLQRWRGALQQERLAQANPRRSPIDAELLRFEPPQDLSLFASAMPWLQVLRAEDAAWPGRVRVAVAWSQEGTVAGRDGTVAPRQLRAELVSGRSPTALEQTGQALLVAGQRVRDLALDATAQRLERDIRLAPACPMGEVVGGPPRSELAGVARAFLQQSEALGPQDEHWTSYLGVAMGRGAREGWPARLNRRWLIGIFGASGLLHGLSLEVDLPRAWGASAFARALANLGQGVLMASRPKALPLGLHLHPIGVRQHRWRWLFATLLLERSFGRVCLNLSGARLVHHQRQSARALAASMRIDALRVVLLDALARGHSEAEEVFAEWAPAALGRGVEPRLLGLLPQLRPLASSSFVASLLGRGDGVAFVDRHDEDWFRNPKAAEQLRHLATQARSETLLDVARLLTCSSEVIAWLETFL